MILMFGRSVLHKIRHKRVPKPATGSECRGLHVIYKRLHPGGRVVGVKGVHWAAACGCAWSKCDLRPPQQSTASLLPQVAHISIRLWQLLQIPNSAVTLQPRRSYHLQQVQQGPQQLQQPMEVAAELPVPQQLQLQSQQEPIGQQQQQHQQQQPIEQGFDRQQQQQLIQGGVSQPKTVAQINGSAAAVGAGPIDPTAGSISTAAALPSSSDTQKLPQEYSSSRDDQPNSQAQQQQEEGQEPQGNKQKQQKPQKPRPTHFVSLRVSHSPQVIECFERVQQQLVSVEPKLQPCLLEPVTAHMTILVLHIQTEEHEAVAASVMSSLPEVLQQQGLGQLQVTLQGLSTFRNQVLYLDAAPGPALDQLQRLGDTVISHFRGQGSEVFLDEGGRGFTPHVTVAKTSRLKGFHQRHKRGRANTKIPQEAWSDMADVSAGDVLLTELQICNMQGRKTGEFYKVTHSVQLPEVPLQPPPQPPAAAPAAAAPAEAAAPAAAAAAEPPVRQRKRAAGSPLAGAKQRFKGLLDALVCRRREELGHVDTDSKQPSS